MNILGAWRYIWHERSYALLVGRDVRFGVIEGKPHFMGLLRNPLRLKPWQISRASDDADIPF